MFKETFCFISMLFGHHTCPDEKVLPAKSTSQGGAIIANVHAGNERGKTHVTGSVSKGMCAGTVSTARTHLDITATKNGKVIRKVATGFSPSTIPASRQGNPGRSTFAVNLSELPSDAEIAVAVHDQPMRLCPHYANK